MPPEAKAGEAPAAGTTLGQVPLGYARGRFGREGLGPFGISAMDDRAGLGASGEKAAERFLRRLKYRIVTRNYRCPAGELDLVVLDGKTVVFVEVKTRTGREHADPQDAVNHEKQRHIHRAAQFFIRQTGSEDRQFRFDVVAIVRTPSGKLDIEHLPGAFAPA